jgi:hypothetical protein
VLALTYFCVGDDVAAMASAGLSLTYHPIWLSSKVALIAASQQARMQAETARTVQNFAVSHPGLTIANIRQRLRFKHARDFLPLEEQLRTAGIPTLVRHTSVMAGVLSMTIETDHVF